ncbi:inosine/xanthosine triphosphatase [Neptunicella marina]|uniref:Inosine/xanthosine triphosphatase n=1 Tax=Neptunicella marina TaxID=2125989 RepID=A0A8J6M384_9ALTE|nr:inosine/xanthosine triphosphatase [Neptunicella marina]MBC3767243.1 inosine/xanthosine triphosphatase [Neptunicella marina]
MKKLSVVVGSTNPVKVSAVKNTFELLFSDSEIECQGVKAPSGVDEQPMTEHETLLGAKNRVEYCSAHYPADFSVAIEGGVDCFEYGAATFAFVVIKQGDRLVTGRSANLPLPTSIYQDLAMGEELGPLMDKLFNTQNIKQKGGAIGLLTNGHATRGSSYEQAIIHAMAPFLHAERYF